MVTVIFAETLENLQHSTLCMPEGASYVVIDSFINGSTALYWALANFSAS
jgi:hypothetical protein